MTASFLNLPNKKLSCREALPVKTLYLHRTTFAPEVTVQTPLKKLRPLLKRQRGSPAAKTASLSTPTGLPASPAAKTASLSTPTGLPASPAAKTASLSRPTGPPASPSRQNSTVPLAFLPSFDEPFCVYNRQPASGATSPPKGEYTRQNCLTLGEELTSIFAKV